MRPKTVIVFVSGILLVSISGFLLLQFGSCTEKGSDVFSLEGADIYRYEIYAEAGETISIDWKASDGVWVWYTDAQGNPLPAIGYCFGSSGLWVSGIAEPGIAYEHEPA